MYLLIGLNNAARQANKKGGHNFVKTNLNKQLTKYTTHVKYVIINK